MKTIQLPSLSSVIRSLVGTIAVGFTLAFVGLQIAFSTAPNVDIVRLINTLGLWLYLPLPILIVLGALTRSRAAMVLAAPLLWFGVEYGSLFLPHPVEQQGRSFHVMTWNVWYRDEDVQTVAGAIRAEQPDVVAFQELGMSMSDGLMRELQAEYPYQLMEPQHGTLGMGILSRYPVERVQPATDPTGYCRCQHVWIVIGERRIELINVHPSVPDMDVTKIGRRWIPIGLDTSEHQHTVDLVMNRVRMRQGPLLMVGDFNMSDRQPAYRDIRSELNDSYREVGWGFGLTFPNQGHAIGPIPIPPIIRIDYVFFSPEWTALEAHTGSRSSSDHRYLVAHLTLPE